METIPFDRSTRLAVLTGAGISAESGVSTFRDKDGLWSRYNLYEVATPEAFVAGSGPPVYIRRFNRPECSAAW